METGATLAQEIVPASLGGAFAPGGKWLAALGPTNLFVWPFASNTAPRSLPLSLLPKSERGQVAVSPNEDRIAVSAAHMAALVFLDSGRPPQLLAGHKQEVRAFAFSPDGALLATASFDASVRIWNAQTAQLLQSLHGQPFAFEALAFSSDGSRLAAGGVDGTVRLWETREWQPVGVLQGDDTFIHSLSFGPADLYIAAGGRHFLRVYEAPRSALAIPDENP